MKKLLIVLVALGIFQIGSALVFNAKKLDEPVIIASAVDFNNQQIHVSYITNRLQPAEIQSITIGDVQYYPNANELTLFNNQELVNAFANYTYYSIIAPSIRLYVEQFDEVKQQLQLTREAIVSFKDGYTEQVTLDIQEYKDIPQFESILSSGGSEGSNLAYKAREPMTIQEVELVKGDVNITYFAVNGKEIELPLQAPVEIGEKEQLHLNVTDILTRFPGDKFIIHLHVTNENGAPLVLELMNNINGAPSEQWVLQMIEEREKQ